MPQALVPDATLANLNSSWTATGAASLHECTDDTIAGANDNADYALGPSQRSIGYYMFLRLSNPGVTPDPSGTYKIRARARRNSGLVVLDLRVELRSGNGATLYAALDMTNIGGAYATQEYTLSGSEVSGISDLDDLGFLVFASGTGNFSGVRLTALEFQVPDAAPPSLELTRLGAEAFSGLEARLVTRSHVEVLGALPTPFVTRGLVEVLGGVPEPFISRSFAEILGAIATPRVSRAHAEILAAHAEPRVTRAGVEAIAQWSAPRFTKLGLEVYSDLGDSPSAYLSRVIGEVIAGRRDAHVSRVLGETIAQWSAPRFTRLGLEVYSELGDTPEAYVSRAYGEILAGRRDAHVSRAFGEAIAQWSEPRFTRTGVEVYAETPPSGIGVTRNLAEVLAGRAAPRLTRNFAEVLAEYSVSPGVTAEVTRFASEIYAQRQQMQGTVYHRIKSGATESFMDSFGNNWDADRDYSTSDAFETTDSISGTTDPELYQDERYAGTWNYTLSVPNGDYTIRCHFAEIFWTSSGQRVFDVLVNGDLVEDDLDIFAEVGHDAALVREYAGTATGGTGLQITFVASVDTAKCSAIEVIGQGMPGDSALFTRAGLEVFGYSSAMDGQRLSRYGAEVYAEAEYPMRLTRTYGEVLSGRADPRLTRVFAEAISAIAELDDVFFTRAGIEVFSQIQAGGVVAHHRINSGGGAYTDTLGQDWDADRDFVGVSDAFSTADPISGTEDDTIYQTERYGIGGALWGYELDVPNGTYRLRIHEAELFWESNGQRVFDVEVNGTPIETGIDIHAEVGHDAALVREYEVTVSGGIGLSVYFRAQVDSGKCAGIEVLEDVLLPNVEATRFAAETWGQQGSTYLTRVGAEAIASAIQDTALLTRVGAEAIAENPNLIRLSRTIAEVVAQNPVYAYASRLFAEVASRGKVPTHLSRFAAEIFGFRVEGDLRSTRFNAEVFGSKPTPSRLSRFCVEAFAQWIQNNDSVRATRVGAEIFARIFGQTPFTPLELEASDLFIANWRDGVTIDSTWSTDITLADKSGAEERTGLIDRPYRIEEVTLTGLDKDQTNRLVTLANRHGEGRLPAPIYCDHSRVTAPSGGTVIFCDTQHRRFFGGGRILIHGWTRTDGRLRPAGAEYAFIDQVTPTALVLQEPLTKVFDRGDRVFPAIDAEVNLAQDVAVHTDVVHEMRLRIHEVIGQSALPSTVVDGNPPNAPIHDGFPVLVAPVDWSVQVYVRAAREGDQNELGRGVISKLRGDRPRMEYAAQYQALLRSQSWRLLEFFDSRRGRVEPFWFVAHGSIWQPIAVGRFHIDVIPVTTELVHQQKFFRYVALSLRDSGTVYLRAIDELRELDADTWRIEFASPLPTISLANVRRVTSGHFVRFTSDTLRERWSDDEKVAVSLGMIDLHEETEVSIPIADQPDDIAGIGEIGGLYLWLEASKGAFNGTVSGARGTNYPTPSNRYITAWDDARHDPDRNTSSDPCAFGQDPDLTRSPKTWEFPSPTTNAGRRAAYSKTTDPFTETRLFLMDGNTHVDHSPGKGLNSPYWSNADGMTLFWCGALQGKSTGVSFIRSKGSHDWNFTDLKLYATKGVDVPAQWASYPDVSEYSGVQILVARWGPTIPPVVYQNGNVIGQAVVTPPQLDSAYDEPSANEPSAIVVAELGEGSWTNAFLIFRRGLNPDEIDVVGRQLASTYGTQWSDLT